MDKTRDRLKHLFTAYWEYLAVHGACKSNLFDTINLEANTFSKIQNKIKFNNKGLKLLLSALDAMGYLTFEDNKYFLTKKSELLTENHPETLKNACILWGMEHMDAWQHLDRTLKTGLPYFKNYFDHISHEPHKLANYHKAMNEYAIEDYKNIVQVIDFSGFSGIMDIGGGLGALVGNIKDHYPGKECYLFEKPEVIDLVENSNINLIKGNFFKTIPKVADCIILSRIIHDWKDDKAKNILNNCYDALPKNGTLIMIENFSNQIDNNASLLSLNMMVMCNSYERTEKEYLNLLKECKFNIQFTKKLNELQNVLIAEK